MDYRPHYVHKSTNERSAARCLAAVSVSSRCSALAKALSKGSSSNLLNLLRFTVGQWKIWEEKGLKSAEREGFR